MVTLMTRRSIVRRAMTLMTRKSIGGRSMTILMMMISTVVIAQGAGIGDIAKCFKHIVKMVDLGVVNEFDS